MRVLAAGGDPPPERALAEAARALRAGWPVVLPTDTVYGLAAPAGDARAAGRLFALKGRPPELAVPVLLASVAQVDDLAVGVTDGARALMAAFWPGGLTVVVRCRPGVGLHLGGPDDGTLGLRVPAHPVPITLAEAIGPLAATSANRHGRPTPATAREAASDLAAAVDVVLDGGPCEGSPSTVVSCVGEEVVLLREGRIRSGEVWEVLAR